MKKQQVIQILKDLHSGYLGLDEAASLIIGVEKGDTIQCVLCGREIFLSSIKKYKLCKKCNEDNT